MTDPATERRETPRFVGDIHLSDEATKADEKVIHDYLEDMVYDVHRADDDVEATFKIWEKMDG